MGSMEGVGAEQTTCILINAFGYPNHPFSDFPRCVAPSVSVFFFSLLIFQILPLWLLSFDLHSKHSVRVQGKGPCFQLKVIKYQIVLKGTTMLTKTTQGVSLGGSLFIQNFTRYETLIKLYSFYSILFIIVNKLYS